MKLEGNQSILDVCLAATGSIENMIPLMAHNSFSKLDISTGSNVDLPFELITDSRIVDSFDQPPATFRYIEPGSFNISFSQAFQ